jgi:hypothetical protein
LLGSDAETDNKTTFAARQQIVNKEEFMAAARERLGKHVPAATDTRATIQELLETVLSTWSMKGGYITRTPALVLS